MSLVWNGQLFSSCTVVSSAQKRDLSAEDQTYSRDCLKKL